MDADGEILFSSFLAGALLKYKTIEYVELTNQITLFENTTNYNIVDDGYDKLSDIISDNGTEIRLNRDFDNIYNNICTIKEYLYSMTNIGVRSFFEIDDISIENNNDLCKKKYGILNKGKTRVLRWTLVHFY